MRAGGQYHYSLVTCTRQNNTSCIASEWTSWTCALWYYCIIYGCTQEHHSLAKHAEHRTCKPYCPRNSINIVCSKQRTCSFPLDFKYSLWTSSAGVNNEVGCLGNGCPQRRRAGDEKKWIILEWPNVIMMYVIVNLLQVHTSDTANVWGCRIIYTVGIHSTL